MDGQHACRREMRRTVLDARSYDPACPQNLWELLHMMISRFDNIKKEL